MGVDGGRQANAHGMVHKIIQEKTEQAKSQAAVIEVIPLMPGMGARKDGRDYKAQHNAEKHGQGHPGGIEFQDTKSIAAPLGIAEEEFADKRAERGGKHTDVQVVVKIQLF